MNIVDLCEEILLGEELSSKLLQFRIDEIDFTPKQFNRNIKHPGRSKKMNFSSNKAKFPKKGNLVRDEEKAKAIHFFANHELLAIEIMCLSILKFIKDPKCDKRVLVGILNTIIDEQKHLKLYINRVNEFGHQFGDFSLNDFFWKQACQFKNLEEYFSVMSLTFEAANLDFACYYSELFKGFGDEKTSKILDIVLADEIQHVKLGVVNLGAWKKDKKLWDFYLENLPFPVTPERSKGINYNKDLRIRSGLSEKFLNSLDNYRDDFTITKRKSNEILEL